MDFPKNIKKRINGIVVEIKPYLTTNVIDAILATVKEEKNYGIRIAMADAIVLAQCTDLEDFHTEDDNIDLQMVDVYRANGFIDAITREISGYEILLSGLDKIEVSGITDYFENALAEFTKEFENINLDEQQKKFENTLNELRQAEAKKETVMVNERVDNDARVN